MLISPFLAIDPGFDRCGWAVLDTKQSAKPLAFDCMVTEKSHSFFDRLSTIITQLDQIIKTYHPTELAIETLFFSKNVKTAMRVAEVRGAITGLCLQHQMKIFEYSPVQVKQAATGNGKADKKAVEKMVRMQLGISPTLELLDDTLDALAVGITHQVARKTKLIHG